MTLQTDPERPASSPLPPPRSRLQPEILTGKSHGLDGLIKGIETVHDKVSIVARAAGDDRANEIAIRLANWGITRICPVGTMQDPPFTRRHDGRPALADFPTWTDWES